MSTSSDGFDPRRVLIAESESSDATALHETLVKAGYECRVAPLNARDIEHLLTKWPAEILIAVGQTARVLEDSGIAQVLRRKQSGVRRILALVDDSSAGPPAGFDEVCDAHAPARIILAVERGPREDALSLARSLLRGFDSQRICRLLVDHMVGTVCAEWCAVLYPLTKNSALSVTASIGPIPRFLLESVETSVGGLAAALGWSDERPRVVVCEQSESHSGKFILGVMLGCDQQEDSPEIRGILVAGGGLLSCDLTGVGVVDQVVALAAPALTYSGRVEDLRIADRTKSEFVATMSHELRNPLSVILGYIDLLVHGDVGAVGEEQLEVLRRAHRSADSLLDLINATLDVSRFEVGDAAGNETQVNVADVLRDQVDHAIRSHAGEVGRIELAPIPPLTLYTDALKLRVATRQVLDAAAVTNRGEDLQVTACEFDGGIAIEVLPLAMGPGPREAPVMVSLPEDDTSLGVPFALFVGKRLIEILGGTLGVWRTEDPVMLGFRMWIPPTNVPVH